MSVQSKAIVLLPSRLQSAQLDTSTPITFSSRTEDRKTQIVSRECLVCHAAINRPQEQSVSTEPSVDTSTIQDVARRRFTCVAHKEAEAVLSEALLPSEKDILTLIEFNKLKTALKEHYALTRMSASDWTDLIEEFLTEYFEDVTPKFDGQDDILQDLKLNGNEIPSARDLFLVAILIIISERSLEDLQRLLPNYKLDEDKAKKLKEDFFYNHDHTLRSLNIQALISFMQTDLLAQQMAP